MVQEDISKYKDTYLSEAKEHVAAMNKALLKLEKQPAKLEFVSNIFREAHTLKSMSAAMDYNKISILCHAIEDILDLLRKRKIRLNDCADILFKSFDALDATLKELKKGKEEIDTAKLLERLRKLATAYYADKRTAENADKSAASADDSAASAVAVEKIQAIEVKVEKLDLLMNLAEELLISKMQIDQIKKQLQNPGLTAAADALGRVVTDIQYNVMQSRMVPIGFVFNRFPRMARDLAKAQKKEVNLEMRGADIELDRGIIDEIGDSLVHLIRNAVDHGLETQEARKKSGKPAQGTISLSAARAKGFVVIKVSDDGAGLDFEDIKSTAIKRGIISGGANKEEIMNTIFFGVSTTKKVTAVSGRGFGVNIVKEKIESIGGSINVDSEPKKGTTFTIEIPLTLAIIKSLFVEVGGKLYAIPLVNIDRLVTINKRDIRGMLNYEAFILDEEEIPFTRLDALFGAPSLGLEKQPIAIVRKGRQRLGLAVDALSTAQEIVIKPLSKLVRENKYFAGSTIIGSGEVVLILDVANLMLTKRKGGSENAKNNKTSQTDQNDR